MGVPEWKFATIGFQCRHSCKLAREEERPESELKCLSGGCRTCCGDRNMRKKRKGKKRMGKCPSQTIEK